MLFRSYFPKNFKCARLAHQLSGKAISDILEMKGSGHVAMWETKKNIPSLELLNKIMILFAVSSDWLLGYTDEPYNEKVISSIEISIFAETIENNGVNIPLLRKVSWIPEEYWNAELRTKTYSLPVRANIIFLLHIYIAHRKYLLEDQFKREASSPLVNKIMDKKNELQENTTTYQKKKKQLDSYMKQLQDLLAAKESAKPIFDIQAQKTTEE